MLYSFDDYVLDTDRRELRRGDGLLPVEPKVFDLLVYLIGGRAPGRQQGGPDCRSVDGSGGLRLGAD